MPRGCELVLATTPCAEYIRHGLRWSRFTKNLEALAAIRAPHFELACIATMNALCVSSLFEYLTYLVGELEARYQRPISMLSNLIDYPFGLSTLVLTSEFAPYLDRAVSVALRNAATNVPKRSRYSQRFGWGSHAAYLGRLRAAIGRDTPEVRAKRAAFARHVDSLDERRGTEFEMVFPEYRGLLKTCRRLSADERSPVAR